MQQTRPKGRREGRRVMARASRMPKPQPQHLKPGEGRQLVRRYTALSARGRRVVQAAIAFAEDVASRRAAKAAR